MAVKGGSETGSIRARAFAKINLTLRVLGLRSDGYHELRTTFQSIGLHDTLTFAVNRGPFRIECDVPACPMDRDNLVWQAAQRVWGAAGRRGAPRDLRVSIRKRIPLQAGLGGASSDAAVAVRALAALWRVDLSADDCHAIAAGIGSDVPFFLTGGTALGLERGDLVFPLPDWPSSWVVLAIPGFGVSTKDAYKWFDESGLVGGRDAPASPRNRARRRLGGRASFVGIPAAELVNDLVTPVAAHYGAIHVLTRRLRRAGASYAAMSGSGSTVFGLFATRDAAKSAAEAVAGRDCRTLVTRTISRRRYGQLGTPALP